MSLKAAVIGLGTMGQNHVRALKETSGVEIVGIADLDESRATSVRDRFDLFDTSIYDDYHLLLNEKRPDVVSVATPDHQHIGPVVDSLKAGANVLVEKPLATNLVDCDRILEVAGKVGKLLMVNFTHRWALPYAYTKSYLQSGEIGSVRMVYARKDDTKDVVEQWPWLADELSAAYLSSHDIDLVCWWLETTITEVYTRGVKGYLQGRGHDNYDSIQASVSFGNGAVGTFESSWAYPRSFPTSTDSYISLVAERGMIKLDRAVEMVEVTTDKHHTQPRLTINAEVEGRLVGGFPESVRHFLRCVTDNRRPDVTLESSRHVAAVVDAIQRSLKSGKPELIR